jgi:hypothetical protein
MEVSTRGLIAVGVLTLLIVTMLAGLLFTGDIRSFSLVGLSIAPFMLLAVLAYMGVKNQVAAILCYILLLVLMFGLALVVLALSIAPFMNPQVAAP